MAMKLRGLAETAALLREQGTGVRKLVEECLAARDPELEAYQYWDPERSRAQADLADTAFAEGIDAGPLQGIPISVKDIYGLSGYPTHAGSPAELTGEWCKDGPVVGRARRQLAPVTGKTRTVEFAFGGIGTNQHWPMVRNPWDRARVAGGSSTGAGVSIAEGSALLAFGTDTAGSIRVPASFTGCAGLKTTSGRWPIERIVPLSPTLDTPGVIAGTVDDLAFAFAALDAERAQWRAPAPASGDVAGLRIGVPSILFFDDCDPGVAETVRAALSELEAAGARLIEADLPRVMEAWDLFRAGSVQAPEIYEFLTTHMPERLDTLNETVRMRVIGGKDMTAVEYLSRRRRIVAMAAEAAAAFEGIDVMATPTVAIAPPRFDEVEEIEAYRARNVMALRNTTIGNIMGLCALTMPVGLDSARMPVGLQLMAAAMGEAQLLEIGRRVEAALGSGEQRIGRPPVAKAAV